jgi:NitT/TauT family transport system substrate-binding protein
MQSRICLSRRLAAVLAGLLLAARCFAAPEVAQLRFTLDWLFTGAHAPLLMAVDGGNFARQGLDVSVQRGFGSGETVRRVAEGEFEVGMADLSAIVQHNALNPQNPVTAFYVLHDRSPMAVITLEEKGIRTPADLRGKLLAAPEGEAARSVFPVFAQVNGLDVAQVRWQSVEPALRETLLVAGTVDAITGYSYAVQYLELQGVRRERIRLLRYAEHGVEFYGAALFARADFLRRNPQTAAAFAKAANEALLAAIAQPSMAIEVLRRRMGTRAAPETELQRLREALDEAVLTLAVRRYGLSAVDPLRLQRQVDQLASGLRLPRVPEVASVYTGIFLPSREERQVRGALMARPPQEPGAGCPPLRSAASLPGCR